MIFISRSFIVCFQKSLRLIADTLFFVPAVNYVVTILFTGGHLPTPLVSLLRVPDILDISGSDITYRLQVRAEVNVTIGGHSKDIPCGNIAREFLDKIPGLPEIRLKKLQL